MSLRPDWSTELVPGQTRLLHRKTLSQTQKQKKRKQTKKSINYNYIETENTFNMIPEILLACSLGYPGQIF